MNNIKNTRGFTLVELLAVIVVLAIVMVIAVNAIMPQMAEARKNVFAIEVNGAIESAQTYFTNNNLKGKGDTLPVSSTVVKCVTIKTLYEEGVSELNPQKYIGRVVVKLASEGSKNYVYAATLQNGSLMAINQGFEGTYNKDVIGDVIKDYSKEEFDKVYAKPTGGDENADECTGATFPSKAGDTTR